MYSKFSEGGYFNSEVENGENSPATVCLVSTFSGLWLRHLHSHQVLAFSLIPVVELNSWTKFQLPFLGLLWVIHLGRFHAPKILLIIFPRRLTLDPWVLPIVSVPDPTPSSLSPSCFFLLFTAPSMIPSVLGPLKELFTTWAQLSFSLLSVCTSGFP